MKSLDWPMVRDGLLRLVILGLIAALVSSSIDLIADLVPAPVWRAVLEPAA